VNGISLLSVTGNESGLILCEDLEAEDALKAVLTGGVAGKAMASGSRVGGSSEQPVYRVSIQALRELGLF
jgi:hypothetical protein